MAKAKISTPILPYPLFIAAILLATLSHITAQSPASAPAPALPTLTPPTTMPPMPETTSGPSTMAPSPGLDCFPYLIKLTDCLTFVEVGSNLTRPDPGCCPEVSGLISTQPICLCQLLANPDQIGIPVDVHKGLKLPSLCNLSSTPPVSLCALIGVPVSVSGPSEAPSPGGSVITGGPIAASPSDGASPPGIEISRSPTSLGSSPHFLIGSALVLLMSFI